MAAPGDEHRAFLGTGWSHPPKLSEAGGFETISRERDIEQAIRIILGTNPGERLMRPDFGAGLDDFLFEPLEPGTVERLQARVFEALVDWEPRIDVLQVHASIGDAARGRVDLALRYLVRETNTLHNLVYPFYLDDRGRG